MRVAPIAYSSSRRRITFSMRPFSSLGAMTKVEMSADGYGSAEPGGDELVVRIRPELQGGGDRPFDGVPPGAFELLSAEPLDDGSVELRYRPKGFDGRDPV